MWPGGRELLHLRLNKYKTIEFTSKWKSTQQQKFSLQSLLIYQNFCLQLEAQAINLLFETIDLLPGLEISVH